MKRAPGSSAIRAICIALFCAVLIECAIPPAFAQRGGGHFGGAHMGAPVSRPPAVRPVARAPLVAPGARRVVIGSPVAAVAPRFVVGYPYRPILPRRPVLPVYPIAIVPPLGFGLFGLPFFGYGFGSMWGWGGCDPLWSWGYGCDALPLYGYGSPYSVYPALPPSPGPQPEIQNWPAYSYGEYFSGGNSPYVELDLKDGTAYYVTDYWLVGSQMHFKTLEESGTKVVEHTIDYSQLDLQKTIDVNTARGFHFVLRDEPLEQYLKDHPSPAEPYVEPPEPGPMQPPRLAAPPLQPPA